MHYKLLCNTRHSRQCEDRPEGKMGNTKDTKTQTISNKIAWKSLRASLSVRGECDWPSIKQILFVHTTPTPTGCLLPCHWGLLGMHGGCSF